MKRKISPPFTPLKDEKQGDEEEMGIIKSICARTIQLLEEIFYKYGLIVARYPWIFIIASVFVPAACGVGLKFFEVEKRQFKLWIPQDSDFIEVFNWQKENFPNGLRQHTAIIEGENLLTKASVLEMMKIHKTIQELKFKHISWKDICIKVQPEFYLQLPKQQEKNSRQNRNIFRNTIKEMYSNKTKNNDKKPYHPELDSLTNKTTETKPKTIIVPKSTFLVPMNIFNGRNREVVVPKNVFLVPNSEVFVPKSTLLVPNSKSYEPMSKGLAPINKIVVPITVQNFFFNGSEKASFMKTPNDEDQTIFNENSDDCHIAYENSCMENSILSLWNYDMNYVNLLSDKDIIETVNSVDDKYLNKFLGGIQRNHEGLIVGANASLYVWFSNSKLSNTGKNENLIADLETGLNIDVDILNWETLFQFELMKLSRNLSRISMSLLLAHNPNNSESNIQQSDLNNIFIGFALTFIYISITLGKSYLREIHLILTFHGLTAVCFGVIIPCGILSACGILVPQDGIVIPLILLFHGAANLYVISRSWLNLNESERTKPLNEKFGLTLKHAGVSIIATSATNLSLFGIGIVSTLPIEKYFCLYAAVGIVATDFFFATYFIAWFYIEQYRHEKKTCTIPCCWKHNSFVIPEESVDTCQMFIVNHYAKVLLKPRVKIFILIITPLLFFFSIWGVTNIFLGHSSVWFTHEESRSSTFFYKQRENFPAIGEVGFIFFGNISLTEKMKSIERLVKNLNVNPMISEVDDWFTPFKAFWAHKGRVYPNPTINDTLFRVDLSQFLHSVNGSKYLRKNFEFLYDPKCGEILPPVLASSIEYRHVVLSDIDDKMRAIKDIKSILKRICVSGYIGAWSQAYIRWETENYIQEKFYLNLAWALLTVFRTVTILIASITTSVIVLVCVLMTFANAWALLHWWGITIEHISFIGIAITLSLSVEYVSHLGHTFMTITGTRDFRTREMLSTVGPVILNSGIASFFGFVVLNSQSFITTSFFKLFFSVWLFGLYHSLVYLPVVLSLIGPQPYVTAGDQDQKREERSSSSSTDRNSSMDTVSSFVSPMNLPSTSVDDATPSPFASPRNRPEGFYLPSLTTNERRSGSPDILVVASAPVNSRSNSENVLKLPKINF